jgi:hypothetical protein
MRKSARFVISLAVAFVGTLLIASAVMKTAVALFMRPPDYGPTWYHWLVWITMFGSLVLSPALFALCYSMLGRRAPKQ